MVHRTKKPPVCVVCKRCGSQNVTSDALAGWNVAEQRWEIKAVLDNETCEACGESGNNLLKEIPVR